ncbi:hypothetical protein CDAR_105771 [Caerostris darwini]|uniref:Uncharacterized protein n=1 Tax=Caerostris darwini TaxID=1538125 RepID=A0AAV4TTY4_9ARAC|nr:hypothetical protein CDAR_105771 [Caerostris darwini]
MGNESVSQRIAPLAIFDWFAFCCLFRGFIRFCGRLNVLGETKTDNRFNFKRLIHYWILSTYFLKQCRNAFEVRFPDTIPMNGYHLPVSSGAASSGDTYGEALDVNKRVVRARNIHWMHGT